MTDKEQPKDVEVPDAPKAEETAPPSLTDLASAGFAPGEIEMAKKHGIAKEEGKTDGDKGDSDGSDAGEGKDDDGADDDGKGVKSGNSDEKGDPDGEKKEDKKPPKTIDERYRILAEGRSPEAIMQEIQDKGIELSPEQEQILIAGLTHNGRTLYWGQKKARLRAQKAEADAAERTTELDKARARIAELEKRPVRKAEDSEEDPLNLNGEEDQVIDPKKKLLTLEDLERFEAEKAAKAEAEAKQRTGRKQVIQEALDDQQIEARERYEDFDVALNHAGDILARATAGTLKDLYPDIRQQDRIIEKAKALLRAFSKADQFDSDQFNAADMAYELGKEHPEYGKKKPTANEAKRGETDVDGNPEDVKRAVNNANRRGSSATLNGGGSRRVTLEELTPEQARRLSDKEYRKLPKATRERLLSA